MFIQGMMLSFSRSSGSLASLLLFHILKKGRSSFFVCYTSHGLRHEKTCLRGFHQSETQPVSSASETSKKIENLLDASLDMILSIKQITKGLIRLCSRAGLHLFYSYTLETGFLPYFGVSAYQHHYYKR